MFVYSVGDDCPRHKTEGKGKFTFVLLGEVPNFYKSLAGRLDCVFGCLRSKTGFVGLQGLLVQSGKQFVII